MGKKFTKKRGSFKNGFEVKAFKDLEQAFGKGKVAYESYTFHYKVDETRRYTPDFYLKDRLIYVEGKGKWTGTDRKKMLLVIEQHPEVQFYMYFVSGNKRLSKLSNTTYGEWCDKHGIKWTDLKKGVPKEWMLNKKAVPEAVTMLTKTTKTSKSSGTTRLSGT